jgi:hypothetical protein
MYNVSLSGMHWGGVDVMSGATAFLGTCTVASTVRTCVSFLSGGARRLSDCVLSHSKDSNGLCVSGKGSRAEAKGCSFMNNARHGVPALRGGTLHTHNCQSYSNAGGYTAQDVGSVLALQCCSSTSDGSGCHTSFCAELHALKVEVCNSSGSGVEVFSGASGRLQHCSVKHCGLHGLYAQDAGSMVEAEACTLADNRGCGSLAAMRADMLLTACKSGGNWQGGFCAATLAQARVKKSTSDGDGCALREPPAEGGCKVAGGGKLVMEEVIADGVCKCGTMNEWHGFSLPSDR